MNKKKNRVAIVIMIALVFGFILCIQLIPDEYKPADDEIALHIQMNTKEDIGLLVFDYYVDDEEHGGGISNADKSLIKSNSDNQKSQEVHWEERVNIGLKSILTRCLAIWLGQFTRNYTQTVKRAADNKRRYAPGWVHSTCLLRGFPKGAAPHLAHDFAEQSVVCYTLCRRCPENTVAAGEGKGI